MSLRIRVIQKLIWLNEKLIFYPRLKRYYKSKKLPENPVILDVGANKGQSIDFFLSLYPAAKIYAFEPNITLYSELKRKYSNLDEQVLLFNYGISDVDGVKVFSETVMSETSTFEDINPDSKYLETKARVLGIPKEKMISNSYEMRVVALRNFLSNEKLTDIDIIKIDVEGHEEKCIRGLFPLNNGLRVRIIQLESHNDDMYRSNSLSPDKLITDFNYHLARVVNHGFGDFQELLFESKTN